MQPILRGPVGWEVLAIHAGPPHAIPIDDHRPHLTAPCCWCGPKIDEDDVWVHKSLDKRPGYDQRGYIT